jgi:hypothetical protein
MQLRNGKVMNQEIISKKTSPENIDEENITTEIQESNEESSTTMTDKNTHQIFKNIIIGRVSEINKVIDKFNIKYNEYKTEQYEIFLENTVKYAKRTIKSLIYLFEFIDKFSYVFLEDIEEIYPIFIKQLRSMMSEHYTHSKVFTIYYKYETFSNRKYIKMMNLLISILGKLGPNIENMSIS